MSFVSRALARAAHDLRQAGAGFALIGAIAVTLRCDPARTTLDIARLATVRLISPVDEPSGVYVDLLFASTGIEDLIVANADEFEVFPRTFISVAKLGHTMLSLPAERVAGC